MKSLVSHSIHEGFYMNESNTSPDGDLMEEITESPLEPTDPTSSESVSGVAPEDSSNQEPQESPTEDGPADAAPPEQTDAPLQDKPQGEEQAEEEAPYLGPPDGQPRGKNREKWRRGAPLPEDDPYWTFGSPPETWGSSVEGYNRDPGQGRNQPRKTYLSCRSCGVKIERKKSHGTGKVKCPMCGRWMLALRQN